MRIKVEAHKFYILCELANKMKKGWKVSCRYEEIEGYNGIVFELERPTMEDFESDITAEHCKQLTRKHFELSRLKHLEEWKTTHWPQLMDKIKTCASKGLYSTTYQTETPNEVVRRLEELGFDLVVQPNILQVSWRENA